MIPSLYIHIPFCKNKCDYCDFFSIAQQYRKEKCNDLTDSYLSSIVKEIQIYADSYAITAWKTIYVGGGTPSLLSPAQIVYLFSEIKKIAPFSKDCEITCEMNPDDVDEEFICACKNAGVNRLSMGIQCLDDKALKAVHRGSSVALIHRALELLKNHWTGRLSVDFIAGLPGHTWKRFESQFEILKEYPNIDHVSLYTLTVEEHTPLAKKIDEGKIAVSYEKADRMWMCGRRILEKQGFLHYEVSNFAKKGYESRHNQSYWKQEDYVGVGAGATGTIYDFEKKSALRWTNTLSIPAYEMSLLSEKEQGLPRTVEILDEETLEFEFLMMGFRMLSGVCDSDFEKRFRKSLAERIGAEQEDGVFRRWQKNHLATAKKTKNGTVYALNRRGILLLNRFLEELL